MKQILFTIGAILLGLVLRAQSVTYTCRYWFDQDHAQAVTASFSDSTWQADIDVGLLSEGLHNLRLQMADTSNHWTPPQTYLFFKLADTLQEDFVCHYWFDQNHDQIQHNPLGNGHLLLDVADLEDGMHTVNILLEGEKLTTTQNYAFIKVAVENPTNEYQYHCWFDNDYSTKQTGLLGAGIFELEVSDLTDGFHTVNIQLDNGMLSVPQRYMFYKRPVDGYLAKWEYWLNDDMNNRHTTNLMPRIDTLDIITLLPLEVWPIRSTCFHFHPNGEEPYINAKNMISFRFWDANDYYLDKSTYYVDENVSEPIVADTLERNTTVSIAAPRNNQIHWFKLAAGRGDYLAFRANKACTMQLFAPSGEEVYTASGPISIQETGFNVWEDGAYYLAVHDANGSEDTVSITYNWVYRYTIASYDVHLVGNGGCSTITVQGNGFNSLLDVYLVNWQNDTIRSLDIGRESNTTTTVSFNFYQENLGAYDAVFGFYEETIRINGALEVQEPVDIVLTTTLDNKWLYFKPNPITFTYTITNNGNMSAYAVPIFVCISSPTKDDISYLEFDGLDIPSLMDYYELDSLSSEEINEIRNLSEEIGDDHSFVFYPTIDKDTGDSIYIRDAFFFMNLAPFETKTITLKITSKESVNVMMAIPSDTIQPLIDNSNKGIISDVFCCLQSLITCRIDIMCLQADWIDFVASVVPDNPVALITSTASCITDILSLMHTQISLLLCDSDITGFFDLLHKSNLNSIIGAVASCFRKYLPYVKYFDLANKLKTMYFAGVFEAAYDCQYSSVFFSALCIGMHLLEGKGLSVSSFDPNDIYGYLSESGSHYIRQEIQNVHYEIEFENDTTLATAAAHTIIVRDTLDASKFDLNSLAARSVTIGDKRLDLNGEQNFAKTLDMRPELYVIAQIDQDYDPTTGVIEWTIQSLDPMTMEPTDDPNQGVLPVNYYGDGVGFIDYSVNLREAFADGTEISNRAGIIFDQEDVIMTPTWTNIVDAVKPTSYIENVAFEADTLNFSFVSSDNRSGVWYHSLYYRNDSTEMQWQVKKAQITENSHKLRFDEYQTTEYLVMATDSAGNVEEKEMVAEYIYYYEGPGPASQTNSLTQGWNWWSTYVEMNGVDGLAMLENSLGHNGLTIKSQSDFTDNYYQDMGEDYWYGSLESIQNEQGYLINVSEACNATMTGSAAIPALHPITIQPYWNWIGYPVASPQAVTSALAGFNPAPDDVVKGQSDFTSYYEGFGWYPDDFMLVPGQSYLYFSNANANKTLTYANGSRSGGILRFGKKVESYWKHDVHAFADNLNVMAVVSIDSEEQRDENLELGAFVNGKCRGTARLRHFAPLDRYYAMLTVSGQEGDLVGFRLIHSESLEENETCGNHLVFSKNAIVGSLGKPYEIRFGEAEDALVDMVLYPNPVERGATFSLMIPSGETVTEVIITDVVGNQLRHETGAIDAKSIKGLPTAGVYVIKAVAKSGNTYRGRLIVE